VDRRRIRQLVPIRERVSGKCLSRSGKDPGTALFQGSCAVPYALWKLLY
jgi:hypothetical protein